MAALNPPLLIAQQVFSLLAGVGVSSTSQPSPSQSPSSSCPSSNGTTTTTTTTNAAPPPAPMQIPKDLPSLLTFLFSLSALRDYTKLLLIGSLLESLRRIVMSLYRRIYDSFFISAHFEEYDAPYEWMMFWLAGREEWKNSRDVYVTSQSFGVYSVSSSSRRGGGDDSDEEEEEEEKKSSRPLKFLPQSDCSTSLWYKGHWMRATRSTREGQWGSRQEMLDICIFTWPLSFSLSPFSSSSPKPKSKSKKKSSKSLTILHALLSEAHNAHSSAQEHTISIYTSSSSPSDPSWKYVCSRPKRPLTSIVLDPGIKSLLLSDARDFLQSKPWYQRRGIPFRRGYLLYGAPGSGKTSVIHSLAGELGLDVYIVSLSRVGMDDNTLSELIAELPERCIALMEDIDAAFNQVINRDLPSSPLASSPSSGSPGSPPSDPSNPSQGPPGGPGSSPPSSGTSTSRISLSGLLNALDGVAAQEGRLLFATTNKYAALDPALCRPGRMDIHIEFKLASRYQAEELYRCFYGPDGVDEEEEKEGEKEEKEEKEKKEKKGGDDSGYTSASSIEKLPSPPPSPLPLKGTPSPAPTSTSTGPSPWHLDRPPALTLPQISSLAKQFASHVPERTFSMAALQGYLMAYKTRPFEAVSEFSGWAEKEREKEREKQGAEKEKARREREEKEKKDKEEREKKEKEEKEKKEKEDKEKTTVA